MNIFVGNLSHDVNDDDLKLAFEAFGQVQSASVIKDKFSGQSRGFGFVEMPGKAEATAAIQGMNGQNIKGMAVVVNEARPREDRGGGGGRGGGGRGGDRGGRGGRF
jgi:cold-inducible RNA-binding protein